MQSRLSSFLLPCLAVLGAGHRAGQLIEPNHAFPALPTSQADPGVVVQLDDLTVYRLKMNKHGTIQELRSTFSHIKSINIDFSLVWCVSLCVDL